MEWATVHSDLYGTSWREVKNKACGDQVLVLDLDVQGAESFKKIFPDATYIFIVPPSWQELEKRLVGREKRKDDRIKNRLHTARSELKAFEMYDYIVVNRNIEESLATLKAIIIAFKHSAPMQKKAMEQILNSEKES